MSGNVPINDLVKHVLLQYKAKLDGMSAYDPSSWEYLPDTHQRNLEETMRAINDTPSDWLPASRVSYLFRHQRTLCRAFASYVFELKKQLGEEWKDENKRLREEFLKRGIPWKEPSPSKKPEVEPSLERQFRAEIEMASKLQRKFCAPWIQAQPSRKNR